MPKGTTQYVGGPTRTRVYQLHRQGLKGTQIAKVLGITHQRVYMHLKELRTAGVIEERSA
jgi:predicted transcriptional regulator